MKAGLESFFEEYLESTSIFKEKSVFQPNFNPEEFSHRDEQITTIAAILAPALRRQKVSNVFIYRKTGTGKTLCVNHITANMQKIAASRSLPLTIISVNCKLRRVADTEYRLIAELSRQLNHDVPSTGLPTEEVYAVFLRAMESRDHTILLILDEIDHLVAKVGSGILYNLTRLNSQLARAQISIVGISNDVTFTDHLDPRVRSSLSEEELVFPPYNALQIQSILQQRCKSAFLENVVDPGVIEKCAAFAAREHGDARRAIELLRVAAELAERDKSPNISLHHMDVAKEKIERDRIEDIISSQPKQYQAVLLAVLRLNRNRKGVLFTGEVYELYSRVCYRSGLRPLTQRRVSDIIAEFDMIGVINAKIISKGRYGRTREIHLSLAPSVQDRVQSIVERSLDVSSAKDNSGAKDNSDAEDSSNAMDYSKSDQEVSNIALDSNIFSKSDAVPDAHIPDDCIPKFPAQKTPPLTTPNSAQQAVNSKISSSEEGS